MSTLKRGTIKAYAASTHKASVQVAGSLAVWLDAIPVATDIPPAEVIAGRECAVLFFTDDNPDDAVVITVHNAVPAAAAGGKKIADANADTSVDTEASANEDKVRITIAGTERGLFQTTKYHVTLTGDVDLAGKVRADPGALGNANAYGQLEITANAALRYCAVMAEIGVAATVASGEVWGIGGLAAGYLNVAMTTVAGLSFIAYDAPSGNNGSLTNLVGCKVIPEYARASTYTTVLANSIGLWAARPIAITSTKQRPTTLAVGVQVDDQYSNTGVVTPANVKGVAIAAMSGGTVATGLEVADPSGGTTKITLEAGGVLRTTPSLRVAPWTPTANLTGVWISEGATPTLRRVQWVDPGAGGANLVAGQRIMEMV